MKNTTMIERYKEENTESKSHKTKVDNGVHPLHWATSSGPSPMGTDPINGFKNGTNGSRTTSATAKQNDVQSL